MSQSNFTLPSPDKVQSLLRTATTIILNTPPYTIPMQFQISNLLYSPNINEITAQLSPLIAPLTVYPTLQELHDLFLTLQTGERSRSRVIGEVLMISGAYPVVLLRLYVRKYVTPGALWLEDWMCIFALLLATAHAISLVTEIEWAHAGQHIWTVSACDLRNFEFMNVVNGYLFIVTHFFIKLCFLTFYYRLSREKYYRWAIFAIAGYLVVLVVITVFVVMLQCKPLDWWDHLAVAKCMDRVPTFTMHGVCMIIADVLILCVPLYIVYKVSLRLREKLLLSFVFGVGGVVAIISVIRVIAMRHWLMDADRTYAVRLHSRYAVLEVVLSLIVCCAPALKTFFYYRGERRKPTRLSKFAEKLGVTFTSGGLAKPKLSTQDGELRRQASRSDHLRGKQPTSLSMPAPAALSSIGDGWDLDDVPYNTTERRRRPSSGLMTIKTEGYLTRKDIELGILNTPSIHDDYERGLSSPSEEPDLAPPPTFHSHRKTYQTV